MPRGVLRALALDDDVVRPVTELGADLLDLLERDRIAADNLRQEAVPAQRAASIRGRSMAPTHQIGTRGCWTVDPMVGNEVGSIR